MTDSDLKVNSRAKQVAKFCFLTKILTVTDKLVVKYTLSQVNSASSDISCYFKSYT